MTATVSIGEFARLTYLSVKTLRYYHEIELLQPAAIEAGSGYRRYSTDQVHRAQIIRRLRELDMPLPEIRAVLDASDIARRDAALRGHLERMEAQLSRTREVVASLRALLLPSEPPRVQYRDVPALTVLAIRATVHRDDIGGWCATTFGVIYRAIAATDFAPTGPGGATYAPAFFEEERGEVVAFVPIGAGYRADPGTNSPQVLELPAYRFAVGIHVGAFTDFDRTYGALGSHVAEHDTALAEPIREIYLVGPQETDDPAGYRTEVCWPIARRA